jgi:hypothetical protein
LIDDFRVLTVGEQVELFRGRFTRADANAIHLIDAVE